MYIISFYPISMMGFVLDESIALQLLLIIPLSRCLDFTTLLFILIFLHVHVIHEVVTTELSMPYT